MPDYLERRGHRISFDLGEVAKRGYKKEFLESILNQNEGKWLNEKQEVIGKLERSVVYVKEESKIKEVPKGYVLMHLNHDSHTFLNLIFEEKSDGTYGVTEECYELIFGRVIDPKKSFAEIMAKIHGSYILSSQFTTEELLRLKMLQKFSVI